EGALLGDPQGVERGRGGALYIGHRFADDRCLWSEHPCRGARSRTSRKFCPNTLSSDSMIGIRRVILCRIGRM
ncbi:hypothetical protein, partial [uncultured Porphyromonas sp.]|uniref:hypothetical protein n=1 Tax=uncultured Porphyromonas sp. TaxID=159274 RepID=UPI0025CEE34F